MRKIPVGLALSLLFDDFNGNCIETLRKISQTGYQGIESMAASPIPISEFVKVLHEFDLAVTSTHVWLREIENDFSRILEFNQAVKCKYFVVPWLVEMKDPDEDHFLKMAERLNKAGKKCKEHGMQLCLHNHGIEFRKFQGRYALDIIYEHTESGNLQAELDTYWVKFGGADPVEYVRKYRDRLPLIHFKDMDAGEGREIIEIGKGILDFNAILEAGNQEFLEWILVEQDSSKLPPFESIKTSFDNLRKMGIA